MSLVIDDHRVPVITLSNASTGIGCGIAGDRAVINPDCTALVIYGTTVSWIGVRRVAAGQRRA